MKRQPFTVIIAFVFMVASFFALNCDTADAATKTTYWLKVNTKTNVVTAYKKSGDSYKPYRAMLCSTGGKKTPKGTFHLQTRYRWRQMKGGTHAQYASRITGYYLFHSVPYNKRGKKNSLPSWKYKKLGTSCSLGCIRLTVMDAKWIYENCPRGTKVTIHNGKYKDPLGKPARLAVYGKFTWDPTDPDSKNPVFKLKKPVITVKKPSTVAYDSKFNILTGVSAKNPNANQSLTSSIKVSKIERYSVSKWVTAKFSTKTPGSYRITYKVYDKYCRGSGYSTYKVKVADKPAPPTQPVEPTEPTEPGTPADTNVQSTSEPTTSAVTED